LSTTLSHGSRLDPPTMPAGELVLQAPPELAPHEGAGGALMMALPMLGSVGSIVFISAAQPGGKSMIAAGMFLVATLGFIGVQIDRQRKQRSAKVGGARREYLQYLAGVRKVVREAADQQRRSLLWHHPAPTSLPALAEDRQRIWERGPDHDDFLLTRYGRSPQALALRLVPPETAPVEQLDPVAASALHRLLVVHRNQPDLPAKVDLRAFSRIEVTGDEGPARGLARSLICSAVAAHRPDEMIVAVLTNDHSVADWEWAKWLPHAQST
jgi:S-DNA-T family DNA segregation ATPase FtsK/SpoIIIE